MRSFVQRAPGVLIAPRAYRAGVSAIGPVAKLLLLISIVGALFWLVWIYGNGLRHPRYLDGWILTGGFVAQLGFHVAIRSGRMSARWAARWRRFHIYFGYLLIAAFISHSDFSLPDTGFEWALWTAFVLISVSGLFGVYLAWAIKTKQRIDPSLTYGAIAGSRAELARQLHAIVFANEDAAPNIALPGLSHDAWIADLYAKRLKPFFDAPCNAASHLVGSQRAIKSLMSEIDSLSSFVDKPSRDKLAAVKILVREKDALDFARVHLWLGQAWLFVHIPMTYALCVLAAFHVLVVYAFSSESW